LKLIIPAWLAFAAALADMLCTNWPVARSYSSWNFDARCAFTWSCDTRTCESDEISFSATMHSPIPQ
jgi:hypothetical protein